MAYLGSWKINDYLTIPLQCSRFSSGAEYDATGSPTYRVYEDETGTPILTGTFALLDDANTVGFYSEQIQLTAANGFEKGKCYTVRKTAVVDGVTASTFDTFQMEAEVDANTFSPTSLPTAAAGAAGGLLTCTVGNVLPDDSIVDAAFASDVTTPAELVALILGEAVPGTFAAGTLGKRIGDYLTGDAYVRIGAPSAATLAADILTLLCGDATARRTGIVQADAGNSPTQFKSNITAGASANEFKDQYVLLTTGTMIGMKKVTANTAGANSIFTVETFVGTPATSVHFVLIDR